MQLNGMNGGDDDMDGDGGDMDGYGDELEEDDMDQ